MACIGEYNCSSKKCVSVSASDFTLYWRNFYADHDDQERKHTAAAQARATTCRARWLTPEMKNGADPKVDAASYFKISVNYC